MTTALAPAAETPIPLDLADLWRFLDAWHAEHQQPADPKPTAKEN